jgi:hypothetical protein
VKLPFHEKMGWNANGCLGLLSIPCLLLLGLLSSLLVLLIRERLYRAILARRLQLYLSATAKAFWPLEPRRFTEALSNRQVLLKTASCAQRRSSTSTVQSIKGKSLKGRLQDVDALAAVNREPTGQSGLGWMNPAPLPRGRARSEESTGAQELVKRASFASSSITPTTSFTEQYWREVAAQEAVKRRRAERQSLRLYEEWLEFLAEHGDHTGARQWALERLRYGRSPGAGASFAANLSEVQPTTSSDLPQCAASPASVKTTASTEIVEDSLETSLETLSVLRDFDDIQRQSGTERTNESQDALSATAPGTDTAISVMLPTTSSATHTPRWMQGANTTPAETEHSSICSTADETEAADVAYGAVTDHTIGRTTMTRRPETHSRHLAVRWLRIHESEQVPDGVYLRRMYLGSLGTAMDSSENNMLLNQQTTEREVSKNLVSDG